MGHSRCEYNVADRTVAKRCECVGDIMQSWNIQVYLDDLTGRTSLHSEPDSSRRSRRRRRNEVGLRRIQTVCDRLPRLQTDQECRGFCVIEIQHHRLRLGNEIAEKGAQLVQRLMVQGDVVYDCDAGLVKRNRAIALVQLTD